MTRSARAWLIFGLAGALAAAAMGWVSLMAVRLDDAEAVARMRAEREERVRLALWRMELAVAPLLAREGSQPYFAYSSFYPAERAYTRMFAGIGSGDVLVPSKLLASSDPMVLLHFQIDPAGRVSSPEAPAGRARTMAVNDGFVDAPRLEASADRLADLGKFLDRPALLAGLPSEVQSPVMLAQKAPPQPPQLAGLFNREDRQDAPPDLLALNDQADNQPNQPAPKPQAQQQAWKPEQVIEQSQELNKYLNTKEYQARTKTVNRQSLDDNTAANTSTGNWTGGNSPLSSSSGSSGSSSSWRGKPQATQSTAVATPARQSAGQPQAGQLRPQGQGGQQAGPAAAQPERVQQSAIDTRGDSGPAPLPEVVAGEMRPLWLGGELVLARRVSVDAQPYVQGCWLNWPELRRVLLDDVRDLLPEADVEPVRETAAADDSRMLAAIPVRLLPGPQPAAAAAAGSSTVRLWLLAAWGGMFLAAFAVALLLGGTLALSERRAAFVSAVTHELRSPLTTFRMYAEMLHEGMVPEESRRRKYLATLRAEAARLGHLVENVLAYARLENARRASRSEPLAVDALLERCSARLAERAGQAGMELVCGSAGAIKPPRHQDTKNNGSGFDFASSCLGGENTRVKADPAAVEQVLFNLVDNACKYASRAADRRIHLEVSRSGGRVLIYVRDHGPGVSPDVRGRMFRPFSRSAAEAAGSAPGVGLGLALSRRLAREMGGDLISKDGHGEGACFVLELPLA